jgi:hypothetical protein
MPGRNDIIPMNAVQNQDASCEMLARRVLCANVQQVGEQLGACATRGAFF